MKHRTKSNILLVAGILLLAAAPMLHGHNRVVHKLRRDTGTTSYSLRNDLVTGSLMSGMVLVMLGWGGRRASREAAGKLARMEATFVYMPAGIFAAAFGCRALLALFFVSSIYSIAGVPTKPNVITQGEYEKLSIGLMCMGGLLWVAFLANRVRFIKKQKSEFGPTCNNCGYSLRGTEDLRCPECGSNSH